MIIDILNSLISIKTNIPNNLNHLELNIFLYMKQF